jgi:hypothetical protein
MLTMMCQTPMQVQQNHHHCHSVFNVIMRPILNTVACTAVQVRQLREAHETKAISAAKEQVSKTHVKEAVEKDAKRMQSKEEALRLRREVRMAKPEFLSALRV